MVKLSYVEGTVQIEPQDVKEFITALLNYMNKDKNASCYVLEVTVKNIREWYESFTRVFNDALIKQLSNNELPDEELKRCFRDISNFIDRRKNFDIADASILFLKRLQDPDDGPSKPMSIWDHVVRRFFIDMETIEKIKRIEELETKFRQIAMNMKLKFKETYILYLDRDSELSQNDIVNVKRNLDDIKNDIITLVTEVREKIGCNEQMIDVL